tara:strand:+ start:2428 stop:2901 length:474 start_codon:yes stop_codon:yes gene_type:complete
MNLNCEERIETPSALKQIIESGFNEYKKNINKQWDVNSKRYIQTYNNDGMENFFKCSDKNLNNIQTELKKVVETIDSKMTNNHNNLTKNLKELKLNNSLKEILNLHNKVNIESARHKASFPMKQDNYDYNSKEYLYFSYYIMSIFTMIYFLNIQIRK